MNDQIKQAIDECNDALHFSECPFSQWEQEFLESVTERFEHYNDLTERQWEILQKMWNKI